MSKEKQIEFERNDISDIIAHTFEPCGKQYDASDFEWSAHCLQMSGYHKQEWISVTERLPDGNGNFLTVDRTGYMMVCYWENRLGWLASSCNKNAITHWMPLPPPPEKEKSNG